MDESRTHEKVFWINSGELRGPREKFMRWWKQRVKGEGVYTPKRVREQDFETYVSTDEIDMLALESLRKDLRRQHEDVTSNNPWLTIPIASIDGSKHPHTIRIPRKPIVL